MGIFDRKPNVEKLVAKRDVRGLIKALQYKKSDITYKVGPLLLPKRGPFKEEVPGPVMIREKAASALGGIGDKRAVEPLIEALQNSFAITKGNYYGVFGFESFDDLRKGISTTKTVGPLLIAVVQALGQIGDHRAVQPLIKALEECPHQGLEDIAWALGRIGDERAIAPLIRTYKSSKSGDTYVTFARIIEAQGLRSAIIKALGEIGNESAAEFISDALLHDHEVIGEACSALVKIGGKRAIEGLIKALEYKKDGVRHSAAVALGKIGENGVELLIEVLGSDSDRVTRQYAAELLGKIGDKRAVEPLERALKDENEYVREYAKEALERILKGKEP